MRDTDLTSVETITTGLDRAYFPGVANINSALHKCMTNPPQRGHPYLTHQSNLDRHHSPLIGESTQASHMYITKSWKRNKSTRPWRNHQTIQPWKHAHEERQRRLASTTSNEDEISQSCRLMRDLLTISSNNLGTQLIL